VEYQRRLAAVRAQMADREIDALVVLSADNTYYLTGYNSVNSWDFQCCIVAQSGDPVQKIVELLDDLRLRDKRLGLEENSPNLGVHNHQRLQRALAGIQWTDASGLANKVRLVKSQEEITCMREAARSRTFPSSATIRSLSNWGLVCDATPHH
jgi:Xaa-Pro aminopeptidase